MSRTRVRELAQEYYNRGDFTGWFEALYTEANGDTSKIPWADRIPNPILVEWLDANNVPGAGKQALVVGCGLGDDAEALAQRGFTVTAFDISAEAVKWCQTLHPQSSVDYRVANLLELPHDWANTFDLVVEIYTLQTLPPDLRANALPQLAGVIKPGGQMIVIARGRNADEPAGIMPMPLTYADLAPLEGYGLTRTITDDFYDDDDPPTRRFRFVYTKS